MNIFLVSSSLFRRRIDLSSSEPVPPGVPSLVSYRAGDVSDRGTFVCVALMPLQALLCYQRRARRSALYSAASLCGAPVRGNHGARSCRACSTLGCSWLIARTLPLLTMTICCAVGYSSGSVSPPLPSRMPAAGGREVGRWVRELPPPAALPPPRAAATTRGAAAAPRRCCRSPIRRRTRPPSCARLSPRSRGLLFVQLQLPPPAARGASQEGAKAARARRSVAREQRRPGGRARPRRLGGAASGTSKVAGARGASVAAGGGAAADR